MKREIENFDQAIREMLRHDIHFELTAGLENGKYWQQESARRKAINAFCEENPLAAEVWRNFFVNFNMNATQMIYAESLRGHPITEGFMEAVISHA